MYSMKDVCQQTGISYETLKFYCKEGLIPHVKRDKNNYRVFDDHNVAWIKGLLCLRDCGMSIKDMKLYMNYCLEGISTIPARQQMLALTKEELIKKRKQIDSSLQYIDQKQEYYNDVLEGKTKYTSHLINTDD